MIEVTVTYVCDACKADIIHPQTFSIRGGDLLPNAYAPPGTVRGKMLCAACTDKAWDAVFP